MLMERKKVLSSWFINLVLSSSMQSSQFQELPSAALAARSWCYHSLSNAAVRNVKVPGAKRTFLAYSTYVRNKCLFTWQNGNINIYHKHSTRCLYLGEHPTLYLSKIIQGLLFMTKWMRYLKMLITKQHICTLGRCSHHYQTPFFFAFLLRKQNSEHSAEGKQCCSSGF